jgi:hypothetical protein
MTSFDNFSLLVEILKLSVLVFEAYPSSIVYLVLAIAILRSNVSVTNPNPLVTVISLALSSCHLLNDFSNNSNSSSSSPPSPLNFLVRYF